MLGEESWFLSSHSRHASRSLKSKVSSLLSVFDIAVSFQYPFMFWMLYVPLTSFSNKTAIAGR